MAPPLRPVALRPPAAAQPPVLVVAAHAATSQRLLYLTGTVLNADGRPHPSVCVFLATNTHQLAVTNVPKVICSCKCARTRH